ncbi:MAG: HRDC domain-containing protein, partial [Candidatus Nanopelagicales bacterium]
KLRKPRQLAAVRELWCARDRVARDRDVSPGRVLPDAAVIVAGLHWDATAAELARLPAFTGRGARRHLSVWTQALSAAQQLPDGELPSLGSAPDGPPPPRSWAERDPEAAARLASVRTAVATVAAAVTMPPENVVPTDALKRICWTPPPERDLATIEATLRQLGARPWQVELTGAAVQGALAAAASGTGGRNPAPAPAPPPDATAT